MPIIALIIVVVLFFTIRDAIAQKGSDLTRADAERGRAFRNLLLAGLAVIAFIIYALMRQPATPPPDKVDSRFLLET
jgi:Na+/H+ antiporter NhaD/arsenite permease-like protein